MYFLLSFLAVSVIQFIEKISISFSMYKYYRGNFIAFTILKLLKNWDL